MKDNNSLIASMVRSGMAFSPNIVKAFEVIDRKDFVTAEYLDRTYDDRPLPVGYGQTISQPSTVAFMLERLEPQKGDKILDVGSGSGWTTALLSYLVGSSGEVIGVEKLDPLVKLGSLNVKKYTYSPTNIIKAEQKFGYEQEAPYDRILVSAAAQEIPQGLVEQLKIGGVMVLPVKSSIYKVTKSSDDDFEYTEFHGFSFVPLVGDVIEDEI